MLTIKFIISFILLLLIGTSSAWATSTADLFQLKADLLINTLAKQQKIPQAGDIEKYLWPAVIARMSEDTEDPWSQEQLLQFTKRDPQSFYTNREAFSGPGITRILYIYDKKPGIEQAKKQYLEFIFGTAKAKKNYNFWTSWGTENFLNMLRSSAYLLALKGQESQINGATQQVTSSKKWLLDKAKNIYKYGVSEWDSSTYTAYNLIGWLNLYDFAEDPEMKKAAQAVLDYYASTIALKYSQGVYGGAEQRGGGAIAPFQTVTDYLSWLWFSPYLPEQEEFFRWPLYLPTIHAATSSYRPPQEAIALANKTNSEIAYYQNYKANYQLTKIAYPEFFYLTPHYTLGSVLVDFGLQVINWKLVTFPLEGEGAQVITGSNSYYNTKANGLGKTEFDYFYQDQNILAQLTYLPSNLQRNFKQQQLRGNLEKLLQAIPCGKTCQSLLAKKLNTFIPAVTYPVRKSQGKYLVSNYLSYPKAAKLEQQNQTYFLNSNGTYLAIFPLGSQTREDHQNDRNYLINIDNLGKIVGFIIEVGDSSHYQSFQDFQTQSLAKTRVAYTPSELTYHSTDNRQIPIDLKEIQANGQLKVNGKFIAEIPRNTPLYDGPNLKINKGILELKAPPSLYRINYQNSQPIFERVTQN